MQHTLQSSPKLSVMPTSPRPAQISHYVTQKWLTAGLIYNEFGHQYNFMIFSPMTVKFIRELCKMNLYSKHIAAPSFGFLHQEYFLKDCLFPIGCLFPILSFFYKSYDAENNSNSSCETPLQLSPSLPWLLSFVKFSPNLLC